MDTDVKKDESVQDPKKPKDDPPPKPTKWKYSRLALAALFFLFATSISWIIAMAFTDFIEGMFSKLRSSEKQSMWRGLYALITFVGGFFILYGLTLLVFSNQPWSLKIPQVFGFL